MVSAGLHCSLSMSKQMFPLLFMFGWNTLVLKATCLQLFNEDHHIDMFGWYRQKDNNNHEKGLNSLVFLFILPWEV